MDKYKLGDWIRYPVQIITDTENNTELEDYEVCNELNYLNNELKTLKETEIQLKKDIGKILFVLACSSLPKDCYYSDFEITAIENLQNYINENIVNLEKIKQEKDLIING